MKIAILTSFRRMPESYSLVGDVIDQIKTLKKHGHDVVFFGQEGCEGRDIDCEVRAILPRFKVVKNVVNQEAKEKIKAILEKELKDFEVVIEHDLIYIGQYVTYRQAIMEANLPNTKWIHWAHSGMSGGLKLKMPRSKYIYMNYVDVDRFAQAIGVEHDDVRVVFNNKDPRLFLEWNPITIEISNKYDLFNRDIMQTYPMCSTRMDAKGIDHVIRVFGKLKKLDNKVLLAIPNSNASKRQDDIDRKMKLASECGLGEDEIFFTSNINPEWRGQVPRAVVRDLMQISNLFIFPSISEVCSNVLLEASITKQLVVLNKDFPALFDFGEDNKTVLSHNFGSLLRSGFKYRTEGIYFDLAKKIHQQLLINKMNQQFLKIKKECNIDTIYKKQLEPLLYEEY